MKYQVLSKNLWKHLTKYICLALTIPTVFALVIRYFKTGMSVEKTFEHVPVAQLPLFAIGIFVVSAIFAYLVTLLIKIAAVEVRDGKLIGRNYWYVKRSLPISSISRLYHFSNNGVEAIVADAGDYGKVYIPIHTENLNELIEFIEKESGLASV